MPNKHQEKPRIRRRSGQAPFPLADLPPEIRILIFEEYMRWRIKIYAKLVTKSLTDRTATTPDLIKALRPNFTLYSEALNVYFDLSTLSISKNNDKRVKYLAHQITQRARSLDLWYGVKLRDQAWELEIVPCFPINLLFRFSNVRQVRVTTTALRNAIWKKPARAVMRNMVKQAIVQLPLLQILILELPFQVPADDFVLAVDDAIGITHCTSLPHKRRNFAIMWDAGNGRSLTWTDETYWRSVPWKNVNSLYMSITNFHRMCFWFPVRLHFLGLNPRPLIWSCADEKCLCTTPGSHWFSNPKLPLTSAL